MHGFCSSRDCKNTFSIRKDGKSGSRKDQTKCILKIGSLTNVNLQVFQEMKDGKLKYVNSISLLFGASSAASCKRSSECRGFRT